MVLIRNLISLLFLACMVIVLVNVGVVLFLAVLAVAAVAMVWYGIKFYFIRRNIKEALHEFEDTRYHAASRPAGSRPVGGEIIEGEFEEISPSPKAEQQKD